jgi:hypothetical protein
VRANGKQWGAQIYYSNEKHVLGSFAALTPSRRPRMFITGSREAMQYRGNKPLNYESNRAAALRGGGNPSTDRDLWRHFACRPTVHRSQSLIHHLASLM